MRSMADIYNEMVELKKKQMEIVFMPVSQRDKSFVKELRAIRAKLAQLSVERVAAIKSIRSAK